MLASLVRSLSRATLHRAATRPRVLPRLLQLRSGPHGTAHQRQDALGGHRGEEDEAEVTEKRRYVLESVQLRRSALRLKLAGPSALGSIVAISARRDQIQDLAPELRWIAPWHAALLEGRGHED